MEKYYISTAIAYTSARPHIGNTYEIVLADAIARYKRLNNFDVYFQTGTDEHGEKIELKAKENNSSPQEYVDLISSYVKEEWNSVNTSYDRFVRTTDKKHEEIVAKIFKKLYDQGDIYKDKYEGKYCRPCESFWTDSQLVDGKCPDCGREVVIANEEAYFLKLSNYSDRLIKHIEENPSFIEPISRKNEIVNNFIKPGLQDLCVSRTSFNWGIPVSFDEKHVIYVWIDALSNYITFLGYDINNESEEFKKYWPADIHLIGKDILRFHTIYWPIILMALDLPLPKKIFGHPWVLCGNDKMSKSKGNILYASELVKSYGVDAIRYYLLHEIPFGNDGTFTQSLLIDKYNADLANVLGNLVNRTISMVNKYFDGVVPTNNVNDAIDNDLISQVMTTHSKVNKLIDEIKVSEAFDKVLDVYRRCNKYIDETTPWILAKDINSNDRLGTVLYNLLESIRIATVLLQAFLPDTAYNIFNQLNTDKKTIETIKEFGLLEHGIKVNQPEPLFIRIDKEEKLKEINE